MAISRLGSLLGAAVTALLVAVPAGARAEASGPLPIAGCPVLPADNVWNVRVDGLPRDRSSDAYVNSVGLGGTAQLRMDFGSVYQGVPFGMPYVVVPGSQPKVSVTFRYPTESDRVGYPVPPNPPIEGGPASTGDRHILMVDRDSCKLYELFAAYPRAGGGWEAGSGAVFDLRSNALRPDGWTSSDAAGLPVVPGLVRYEEILEGEIRHAIRMTAKQTAWRHVWPARHHTRSSDNAPDLPPMGQRFRLRTPIAELERRAGGPGFRFSTTNRIILTALQRYGAILADNGERWFMSGAPDPRFDNDDLHLLVYVVGSDFEAVDQSRLMVDPDSGATAPPPPPSAPPSAPPASQGKSEIIIDNAPPGVQDGARSFSGTWCRSGASNPLGADSLFSCGGSADTYRWTPSVPSTQTYDVYVRWTKHANRSTGVPISVKHAAGTSTRVFDQRGGGARWVLHGRYGFGAGTAGFVQVSGANGQAGADAVRLVPASGAATPVEIVLDNAPVGVKDAARTFTGSWCRSGASNPFGAESLFSCGGAADTYRWIPAVPATRAYDVFVRWTAHQSRSPAVPISVKHAGGTSTRTFNEQTGGAAWVLHGRYTLSAGTGNYVQVSATAGQAAADGVRLVPAAP
jgi:hypothetical protein